MPSTPNGVATATDPNGNQISTDGAGNFTDTTGKVALSVAGSPPSNETFTYTDTTGTAQAVNMTYQTYTVQTAFGCSGIGEYGPISTPLVNSIIYPDGSTYTFSYEATPGVTGNVTGRIAGITLPQGNTIQYTYSGGSNGIECADGSTAGLTRALNSDSGSATSSLTYTRTTPNGTGTSQTAVVDGLSNNKTYNFVEANNQPPATTAAYYETSRSVYQGAASGTAVVARNTCYNGAAFPCVTATFAFPVGQIDTFETIDGLQMHGTTATFNNFGSETEADVYDFGGATARGALLRKEIWTYAYSIPALPTEDDIYDGTGALAGKTVYVYDGATPTPSTSCPSGTTGSSCVPQHAAVSGPRGNLTNVTTYASSGTSYALSATYEDTGSLLTSVTPNGTTTLSYDPTFTYNTGATLPTPSSGVTLPIGESYDTAYTGLPINTTDPNQQVTKILTYDSMLRPTEVDPPGAGKLTLFYSPTQIGQKLYQSSGVYGDTEVQYDGYGRQSRVAVANGQSGNAWYQADICYDANNNAAFTSYPYQGGGFGSTSTTKVCSGSGDIMTHDVLGRLTSVQSENGESRSYTYLGRATKYVDANNVTRISQVDGLGRTTIVCEISSNRNLPGSGSPVSCGTDITGTGFTTTYSYALATPTTTITQGAQTRTFQSDWLGRPTSVQEPESGTTTYSYAYNSTGLKVTRKKPMANQTSASTFTTTTTQYDALSRVTSISYSDGTPTKTFAYDASAGWSDLSQANIIGRLSSASVSNAATVFSYDPVGRISYLDECTPSECGTTDKQLHYTYDWAGNMITSTDGGGVTTTYAVTLANEIQSLTSNITNSNGMNPQAIISNVQYGPNGPTSYTLGNGLSSVYHYDALGRLNGGWVCNGSSSASCSGGQQLYGFTNAWKQQQLTCSSDTVLNQGWNYGYDEFNRLTSRTLNPGTTQDYNWVYDRYGNRTQQNALLGGFSPAAGFNTSTNQINSSGYVYDAAGNMVNDSFHSYTYDAEGNITAVDGGSTATYVFNALNQRVRAVAGSAATEYIFNAAGQRVSEWNGSTGAQLTGKYYWGGAPVAYYAGGTTHFEHQDWLGTERMRTTYNGSVEGTFTSLPFGDGQTTSGTDGDASHFAALDYDSETYTDHAQFRQYSPTQGRWIRPDPYIGSYDISNPQSFNRYAYALNNPLSNIDASGLDYCSVSGYQGGYDSSNGSFGAWIEIDISDPTQCAMAGGQMLPEAPPQTSQYGTCAGSYTLTGIASTVLCDSSENTLWFNNSTSSAGDGTVPDSVAGSDIGYGGGLGGGGDSGGGGGGGGGAPNNPNTPKKSCGGILAIGALQAGLDGLGIIPGEGAVAAAFYGGKEAFQMAQLLAGGASVGISSLHGDNTGVSIGMTGATTSVLATATQGVKGAAEALPVLGQFVAGAATLWDVGSTAYQFGKCEGW